ncbi:MAG: PilN domain-containing protein [Nitrospirae bacterium]|nr:PilN domain-containing protein [Candidatus Manganitrophaceae bacterium]
MIAFYVDDEKKQISLKREVDAILQQREQLQQKISSLTSSLTPIDNILEETTLKKSRGLESLLKENIVWSRVLVEVSRIVPEGVWVTQFENNAAEGVRVDGFTLSYQKVTDLISSMEGSPLFQDVLLDFSRQNPAERRVDFSIHAKFRNITYGKHLEKE